MPRYRLPHELIAILVLAPLAGPARASITPQAQAIVDRYVEASGGRPALDAQKVVHVKGRLNAIQLKGSFDQWTQAPDRIVTRIRLGPVQIRTGYDGRLGWESDLGSNKIRRLEGKELEKLQAEAYFENEMWAREDQGGGKVMQAASSFREGEAFASIDVTPPVGPTRRLWFNEKTGMLARIVARVDGNDSDFWLSEYRKLGGRKRATVQMALDPALRFLVDSEIDRLQIDSLWVNPRLDSSVFLSPASKEREVTWLKGRGTARVPFRYGSRHVWIKVSINGAAPMDFLLDTGASSTAIDREYARKIGLVPEGRFAAQGMGGSDAASFARVTSIRVGGPDGDGVSMRDFRVGIMDIGRGHEEVLWRKMGGLIGYDFLSRFVVQIDYDHNTVTFWDPKRYTAPRSATVLDMKLTSGIPLITAELEDGCSGEFLVDVGNAFGLIVHGSLARRCGMVRAVAGRKQVKIFGGGVGSSFASWLTRLSTMRIGPYAIQEPIAGLALSTNGMVGSQEVSGNIGNAVLERFTCTFDYDRGKLVLEPGRRFEQRDRYSRAGVLLIRTPQRVVAGEILRGSPADQAGLKPEAEVIEIDGKPALGYTSEDMDRLFVEGEVGSSHVLTVLQDGKKSKLRLVLKDVI